MPSTNQVTRHVRGILRSDAHLPSSYVLQLPAHRSLKHFAQLESVRPDLHEVIEQSPKCRYRVYRGEKEHVAELDEQLEVVVVCAFVRLHLGLLRGLLDPRVVRLDRGYLDIRERLRWFRGVVSEYFRLVGDGGSS